MKITRLEIKEYKQFKDLTLDLTYPLGHEKAGEPLDKICIIGQSGVGKTNLLEIIRDKLYTNDVKAEMINSEESDSEEVYFVDINSISIKELSNKQSIEISQKDKEIIDELNNKKDRLIFEKINSIPSDSSNSFASRELLIMQEAFHATLPSYSLQSSYRESAVDKKYRIINSAIKDIEDKYKKLNTTEFIEKNYISIDESAWRLLKDKIDNYDTEKLKYKGRLSNKLLNLDDYEKQDFKDELEEWESNNENILEKISDRLNIILEKFNLELFKLDKNQKSYNDLTVKDLSNGNILKYENLSTGTKTLIATFIPLKIHNPKDSIILIDEPENSFYPDIQRKLTELYMEVGENNQLIMATHSPLIASSFEPWEVVELKFDEDTHQIYREDYFDSENDERHIDNYTLDPRMLTWTGILTQIFDLKEDSNFEIREKALMQYIRLERDIEKIEDKKEKMQKFEELMKLSERLGLSDNEKN